MTHKCMPLNSGNYVVITLIFYSSLLLAVSHVSYIAEIPPATNESSGMVELVTYSWCQTGTTAVDVYEHIHMFAYYVCTLCSLFIYM